ncbi:MAG: hypothetical protein Q4D07_03265 [Selenomonadaceae bacterium]|nr:hypothetical protein [Selenomonadaceae bacterium]
MLKYIGGACAVLLLCGAFFVTAGCSEGKAGIFTGKSEFVVGKDIPMSEVREFYYTIDSSANPPQFLRYRFTHKDGKYSFYYEKREGDTWPLTEKHITASETVELTSQQWEEFLACLKDGVAAKRTDDASSGGSGPWLFLYWDNDRDIYQVFTFADYERQQRFEKLCYYFTSRHH